MTEDPNASVPGKILAEQSREAMVRGLANSAQVGSPVHEQLKVAIINRALADLEVKVEALTAAITRAGEDSSRIGRRLLLLNWILAIATAVGATATMVSAYSTFANRPVQAAPK